MKITNLVLWCQDNRLSEKFYKKLGFHIEQSDEEHSVVSLNGFKLDLVSLRDEELFAKDAMAGDKGRGVYIYIHVDDVDAFYTQLTTKGFLPSTQPREWHWNRKEFILKDPDGYKLCFWS